MHTDYLDLRGLAEQRDLASAPKMGFPLGRLVDLRRRTHGDRLFTNAGSPGAHLTVIGPTSSGKTSGLIVPWLAASVRMGFSTIALDVKGDLLDRVGDNLAGTSGRFGPTTARAARWDYRNSASIGFNWIGELRDERACHAASEALLGRVNPADPNRFFAERDMRLLTGLLEAVRHAPPPPGGAWTAAALLEVLRDQSKLEVLLGEVGSERAEMMLADALSCDPWDFLKTISGLLNVLIPLSAPPLERVTRHAQLKLDDVLSTPGLLTIGAPLGDGLLGSVSGALMVKLLVQRLFARFGGSASPVLIVLDEAARISDRVDLEELLAICAGASATVALALQDLTQLAEERDRSAVLGNCPTIVMMPGCSPTSALTFSQRLGKRPEVEISTTRNDRELLSSGTTHRHGMVPVLGEREIINPPRLTPRMGTSHRTTRPAIVHARDLCAKPILVDLDREDLPT